MSKAEHRLSSRSRLRVTAVTLTNFRRADGSGAPAARILLLGLVLALCALGFGATSATAEAPTVTTPVVSDISYATAHVTGEVDRKDNDFVEWFYEISNDGTNWEPAQGSNVLGYLFEGSGMQKLDGDLEALKPGTSYQVRLVTQYGGTSTTSPEPNPEFTTPSLDPPTVTINPVTTFTGTTATFTGEIDPNPPAGDPPAANVDWHFECTPACPEVEGGTVSAGATGEDREVEAEATGLEPNTTYEVTLIGENAGDPVSDGPVTFKTDEVAPAAQTIPAFVLEGGTSALLGARINPHNSATTYWFEVEGPGGTVAVPATENASAGNGGTEQVLTQKVSGLTAGTTYHFHVVAVHESGGGQSEGTSVRFTTPTPTPADAECANKQFRTGPSASLPECRAFELSSLPDLNGYSIQAPHPAVASPESPPFPAVAEDGNAILWATDGFLPGVDTDGQWDTYVSHRTSAGWTSEYISPPASKRGIQPALVTVSPNLDRSIWYVGIETLDPTDPDIGQKSSGIDGWEFSDLVRREPDGSWVRLTKGPAEQPTVYSGPAESGDGDIPAAFSRDAVWSAFYWKHSPLVSADDTHSYVGNGGPVPLSVPNPPIDMGGGQSAFGVSDDGGTVAYGGAWGIWLWTDGLTRTVVVAQKPVSAFGDIVTEGLSHDGNTVRYSSPYQETSDDTDNSVDLYEFDVATETKRRISAPSSSPSGTGPGNENSCPGSWSGTCAVWWVASAEDGSASYFVSPELLDGDRGILGARNLYVRSGEQTTYVTTFDPDDGVFDIFGGAAHRNVQLTPDQSKLIFQSRARITAYDNAGLNEIYLYDPTTDQITCASCRLNGSEPEGESLLRLNVGGTTVRSTPEKPISIVASDDSGSRVFFATYDSLRAGDTDKMADVYAADLQHGQVSVLGNQTGDQDNFFWGAAADGRDVFISSSSTLSPEEHSVGAYKLYDARVGGGFAMPAPDPGDTCEGDPCRGQGSESPTVVGAATSRLEGPGDPPVKHRKKHKKHHRKPHKKHHKHSKGKKHGGKHRAGDNGRTH